jgi:4-carboxymuconolactone decarboxylase
MPLIHFRPTMPAFSIEGGGGPSFARVAPALVGYQRNFIDTNLWQRPELQPRDRSIVTVAAFVARGHSSILAAEIERALENGVTPAELSETLTHLAFYAGWGAALAAAPTFELVFAAKGISPDNLPARHDTLLPQDAAGEAGRLQAVRSLLGDANPGLADFTTTPLFSEIWLRTALSPRDRSLVTITSLIALGQTGQFAAHLNRALNNGLTGDEAGEVVAHLAFYTGWPTAFSAGPMVKDVLAARQ